MELPAKRQAGRTPDCQHACIRDHGDKHARLDLPPRNHSAPDTDAGGIADLAGSQPVGKETDCRSIDQDINRLRPCLRADIRRGRQQAHFPRIFEPQSRRSEVGRKSGETAVCKHMLPDARRQRFFNVIDEAVSLPAVRRNASTANRCRERRVQRRGQFFFLPDEYRRPGAQGIERCIRRKKDPAPCADEGFQTESRKAVFNFPQSRTTVFALLIAEIDKLGLKPAAFQQTERAQQPLALVCTGMAANDRVIAGDSPLPEGAFRFCTLEAVFPQREHHVHGVVQFFRTHMKAQRRCPHHAAAGVRRCVKHTACCVKGLLRAAAQRNHEAQRPLIAFMHGQVDPHAQLRRNERAETAARVRVKDRGMIGSKAETAVLPNAVF